MKIPGFSVQLDLQGLAWRATRIPGVHWYPIADGDVTSQVSPGAGDSIVLIRMDPGAGYPRHRHIGIEDVLILQGGYRDEFGAHGPGSFVRYPAGSIHSPVALGNVPSTSNEEALACVMFAIAREGVENFDASSVEPAP